MVGIDFVGNQSTCDLDCILFCIRQPGGFICNIVIFAIYLIFNSSPILMAKLDRLRCADFLASFALRSNSDVSLATFGSFVIT